ncbi:hypothetical protein HHL24_16705 [Paraburkholderia sp. RP-4-7]|uniref:Uncharacterized protein n=1 Tax=Paraburkholderia polaris TaxID=2728848 RepID=A0A848II78_9BURK|nr:hypothetical protein [Paraburkholderia polaris]NML99574.1 hypothetical protein [Paraburkholderia polaris]
MCNDFLNGEERHGAEAVWRRMEPVVRGVVMRVNDMNEARKALRFDNHLPAVSGALGADRQAESVTNACTPLRQMNRF